MLRFHSTTWHIIRTAQHLHRIILIAKQWCLAIHYIFIESLHLCANPLVLWFDSFDEQVGFGSFVVLFGGVLISRCCNQFPSDSSRLWHFILLHIDNYVVTKTPEAASVRCLRARDILFGFKCHALPSLCSSLSCKFLHLRHERNFRGQPEGSLRGHLMAILKFFSNPRGDYFIGG